MERALHNQGSTMKKHKGFHFMAAISFYDVFARDSNVKKGIRETAKWTLATIIVIMVMIMISGNTAIYGLGGGALADNQYRVIISTDIGGGDEDDIQSMVHYLLYSDVFDCTFQKKMMFNSAL